MVTDTYSGSAGWSGGSPLQNTGQVLGSYLQKMKTYDPFSSSIKTAAPTTVNTPAASSSLARVVNPQENQPVAAAPKATMQAPVQAYVAPVQVQAPVQTTAVPAGMVPAMGRNLRAVSNMSDIALRGPTELGPTATDSFLVSGYGNPFRQTRYSLEFRNGAWTVKDQHGVTMLNNDEKFEYANDRNDINSAIEIANRRNPQLMAEYSAAKAAEEQRVAGLRGQQTSAIEQAAAAQQAADEARQKAAAQAAIDRAAAFTLAGQLQAPNTSEVDTAGSNDLARVASQYAGGAGGVDSGFYGYLGQRDATTQAAINKVQHDTAYAKSVNANYNTFVTALKAQQQAAGSATAQRLQFDMQGVADALSQVQAQASQLGKTADTKLSGVLNTVRDNLQKYQNAVKQYGAESSQAMAAAQFVLSTASSLATAGV